MESKFIHLHTHSHYSLLNALPKIPDLIEGAKKDGMEALALTDNGNMYGAVEFYKACKKAEIKPIIGVDFYVAFESRNDKRANIDNQRTRLVLIAKNNAGYKNLIKLVTYSGLEGFYYRPRIDKELMQKYSEGLICISPQFAGALAQALKKGDEKKAVELANFYKETFGDVYLEITHHPEMEGQIELKEKIIAFARKHDIQLVATHDVYYMKPEDHRAREVLMAIQGSSGARQSEKNDFSFIDQKTAQKYFKDTPDALENTIKIAEMCDVEIELGKWVFPDFKIPEGFTYDEFLRKTAYEGLKTREVELTDEVKERIEYEMEIIEGKGYSPYFLAVADLIHYAERNGIFTNTRGSAAGSMVSYLIGIVNINPMEYNLPFERFLNPERPSAPDVDMDFADTRRDEVIQYAREKYGINSVAQIGTFGTMAARAAVRDVARAMGYSYNAGDTIAKLIPMGSQGFPMTIDHALEIEPDLEELYKEDQDAKEIIDMAKKIEGNVRHIGVHAAGVVISPTTTVDYTPTQLDPKGGKIITQYNMHSVEDAGLLKFDFLGIKNLTILADAVSLAKKYEGAEVDLDKIDLKDEKTYDMLARGETIGLFQLNGSGMTAYLKQLKPTEIHDINAMVALYRPGPMAFIPDYIARKQGDQAVKYLEPRLEQYLKPTYGILIYQDDVMLIAVNLAGYSWGEADKFRKAMGKKIPAEMAKQKEKFISGCIDGGMKSNIAMKLWEMIETFAAYGFNKAHASSYGNLAYKTSYMKANFPVEYMTAVLTSDAGDTEKIAEIIAECKRMNIPVLPPDINESFGDFTVIKGDTDSIRFGLYTIKNFGHDIADAVIAEREENGKFKSFADFLERIQHKNLNKKSLESLIMCGAMDNLGERGQLMGNLVEALNYHKECCNADTSQSSIFGLMDENSHPEFRLKEVPPAEADTKLSWEKELLGLYISGHPLDKYKEQFEKNKINIKKVKDEMHEGIDVVLAGILEDVRIVTTKKGDRMAFIRIADFTDDIEAVVFPKLFVEKKDMLEADTCVVVKGKLSSRNDDKSVIIDAIKVLD
ncbi:DNA polymerase III subunit alpha [Patescibacteria group bacterium]